MDVAVRRHFAMETPESQPEVPRRKRRWFQYRLRTLFIVMTLAALLCGLFGRRLLHSRQEQVAIGKITALGGRVFYSHRAGLDEKGILTRLIAWTFWEDLDSATGVYLDRTQVTDRDLEDLARLRYLEDLDLSNTAVTDEGLRHVKGLRRLRHVELFDTHVTEAGLRDLRECLPGVMVNWAPPMGVGR